MILILIEVINEVQISYFNPIISLSLSLIEFVTLISLPIYKSHYRSDFNSVNICSAAPVVSHFNPIIGLILIISTMKKPAGYIKFQSHYRSDFNTYSQIDAEYTYSISIPL